MLICFNYACSTAMNCLLWKRSLSHLKITTQGIRFFKQYNVVIVNMLQSSCAIPMGGHQFRSYLHYGTILLRNDARKHVRPRTT